MSDNKDTNYDMIIAVPLSRKKQFKRGYNQSELIAKIIAKKSKIPYRKNILIKQKHNITQSNLNRKQRFENVKNVFKVTNDLKNKKILLIDDIYTTGATVNECARVLKKAGASEVVVYTVARATINSHID